MTRSILFSLLAIGVAVTVIVAAGTQASFTDEQTASGNVDAGTIILYLLEDDDDDTFENENIFDIPVNENLLPGFTTSEVVRLRNDGSSTLTLDYLDFSGSTGADCDLVLGDDFSVSYIGAIEDSTTIAPGATHDITVTVALAAGAQNECQGDVYNVVLDIGVTS